MVEITSRHIVLDTLCVLIYSLHYHDKVPEMAHVAENNYKTA